jgi:hypothetical protein
MCLPNLADRCATGGLNRILRLIPSARASGEDVSEEKVSEMSKRCDEYVDLNDAATVTPVQSLPS